MHGSGSASKHGVLKTIFSQEFRPALWVTIAILLGNVGYYFLRVHFPMAVTVFQDKNIITGAQYSTILNLTYVMNFIGKPIGGYLIDLTNRPRWIFVASIAMTGICAVIVTYTPVFAGVFVFWGLTRLFTSMGKMGVIKIVGAWWPSAVMGTIIGIATVSCSLGETIARVILSQSLSVLTWQQMFYLATGICAACTLPVAIFVRDQPPTPPAKAVSHAAKVTDVESTSTTDFDEEEEKVLPPPEKKRLVQDLLLPLVSQPRFVLLMFTCFMLTILREIYGHWSLMFLKNGLGYSNTTTGSITAAFSGFSALSSLMGGWFIDLVPRRFRGLLSAGYLLCLFSFQLALLIYWNVIGGVSESSTTAFICVFLVIAAEFVLGPPVSYVDGLFTFELAGVERVAFASSLVGCFGYVGPFVANSLFIGRYVDTGAWNSLFMVATVAAGSAFAFSMMYWWLDFVWCRKQALKHRLSGVHDKQKQLSN